MPDAPIAQVPSLQVLQQAGPTPSSITISNGVARLSFGESDRPAFIQPASATLQPVVNQSLIPADTSALSPGASQASIRIMSRASASPVTPSQSPLPRSGSSSTAALTFEEREAAYQEARMRIFAQEAGTLAAESDPVHATPHAANATLPATARRGEVSQQGFMPADLANNSLRPSAPSFVYHHQQSFQPEFAQEYQSQPYAYYPMPMQGNSGYNGLGAPAQLQSQWVSPPEYLPYGLDGGLAPYHMAPAAAPSMYTTGSSNSRPPTRPPSARRSSASSVSNVSQSSVRTASTSSAQRSTSSRNPSGFDGRNLRQTSTSSSHPPGRQTRPEAPFTPSSSNASGALDQFSQSRSSESRLIGSSLASSVDASRPDRHEKGKEREITPLPDAHPSLPSKPAWLPNRQTTESASAPARRSSSVASSQEQPLAGDASREETETLASDSLAVGESPPALTPPAAPSSAASDAGSSIAPSESASQVHTKVHKPQPKIVEYPPLRYDPKRGWTTLDGAVTVASPVLSNHAVSAQTVRQNTVKQSKNHGQGSRRAQQHSQQQQQAGHHPQHDHARQSPLTHMQQAVYAQQPPPGYTLQYVPVPAVQGQPLPPQPQYYYPQPYMQQAGVPYHDGQGQPVSLPSGYQYVPVPVQPGQPAFFPQSPPMQQPQVYQWNGQPMQMMPMQPYTAMPGMTASDIMSTGEMLYSHDIPRPVPRSGATLFDPNKGSSNTNAAS